MTFHQDIGFQPAPPSGFAAMTPGQTVDMAQHLREIQGQNALGAAYQQAIDPMTGRIDQAKLANALAASNSPWMVGPGGIQAGQSMEAQGKGTSAQMDAQRQQIQILNSSLAGMDLSVPHYAPELQTKLDMLNKSGYVTGPAYAQATQMLKSLGPNEPANDLIRSMRYLGLSADEYANRVMPPTVGQQMTMLQDLNAPVQGGWKDKNGVQQQGTKAQYLQSIGADISLMFPNMRMDGTGHVVPIDGGQGGAGGAGGGAGGNAPFANVPGRQTGGTSGGGTSGGGTTTPAPGPSTSGGFGSSTAIPSGKLVDAGQAAYTEAQQNKAGIAARISPLQSALSVIRNTPDLKLAGVSGLQDLELLGEQFGMPKGLITDAPSAYKEVAKYLAQYASRIPGADASDLARLTAKATNPDPEQGREAVAVLAAKAIGWERMKGAAVDYFNSKYPDAGAAWLNSGRFQIDTADFSSKLDPVALALPELSPQMFNAYYQGLSKAGQKRLLDSVTWVHNQYGEDVGSAPNITLAPTRPTVAAPTPTAPAPTPSVPVNAAPAYPPGYQGG